MRIGLAVLAVLLLAAAIGCGRGLFRQYEYEEEVYLSLDGSATIYVNSSVPVLNALRGASFDVRPAAPLDRAAVREYFTTPVTRVTRVSTSRRNNRRFVHVRLEVDDIRRLGQAAPFAWSSYQFSNAGEIVTYLQTVGAVGKPVEDGSWIGKEIVAFRLHIPSRIVYHNAGPGNPRRGNILAWEQPLTERLRSTPLTIDARMEPRSILYSTLLLFGGTFVAVAMMFAVVVWRILRAGRASGFVTRSEGQEGAGRAG
jgi:hypothetical protein